MKIKVIQDNTLDENEIIVTYHKYHPIIDDIQKRVESYQKPQKILLFLGSEEFYIDVDDILFFETMDGHLYAHLNHQAYKTDYKLYELEQVLGSNFVRISKSTICNINYIYSIDRSLTSSSKVSLRDTHKTIYVSRMHYHSLKETLEKRLLNEQK